MIEALGDQHHADDDEEGEGQHLDRRVIGDEAPDRPREHHHQADRGDHRSDHDFDLAHHADRRDDRVEREHQVDHHDLRDDGAEGAAHLGGTLALGAFEQLVDFADAFP